MADPQVPSGNPGQPAQDFVAARAAASNPDPWASLNTLIAQPAKAAPAAPAQSAGAGATAIEPEGGGYPIKTMMDSSVPFAQRVDQAANEVWGNAKAEVKGMLPQWAGGSGAGILEQGAQLQQQKNQWLTQFKQENGRDPTLKEEINWPGAEKQRDLMTNIAAGFAIGGKAKEGATPDAIDMGTADKPPGGGTDGAPPDAAKAGEPSADAAAPKEGEEPNPPVDKATGEAPAEPAVTPPAAEGESAKPPTFTIGGKPSLDLKVTPELSQQFTRWMNGGNGDNPVQASIQAMSDSKEYESAVQDIASFIPKDQIKPDVLTQQMAYDLAKDPESFMRPEGLPGHLPDDNIIVAARSVAQSTANEVWEKARQAMETGDPALKQEAFHAFIMQNRIVTNLANSQSSLGRALRSTQIDIGPTDGLSGKIRQVAEQVGPDNADEVVRKIAALNDPAKVNNFTSGLSKMTDRQGLLYWWYNSLLSNPATVIKKLGSDATVAMWNVATRQIAGLTPGSSIPVGEAGALLHGYIGSFGDAMRAAGKALRAGSSQFMSDYQTMDGQTRTRLGLLANGAEEILPENQPTRAAFHFLQSAMPTSWIGAADDMAKVSNYRAEARALLYRQGIKEGASGALGPLDPDGGLRSPSALQDYIEKGMQNVPQDIHQDAVANALKNTFQEPLDGIAAKIQELADTDIPIGRNFQFPIGRVILPFVKVPSNILKFSYRNSPLPLMFPTQAYRAELAAGGATRDLALARVGLGTGVTMATLGAASGLGPVQVTGRGPSSPELRRAWEAAGNQPYSVRVGKTWYQYNRIEPGAQIVGAVADAVDVMKFAKQEDSEQLAAGMAFGIGNAMVDKTYMMGFANFMDALNAPDQDGSRYAQGIISSFAVPQGVAGLARAADPFLRAHYTTLQMIESRLPYVSKNLPPQRNLWGDPIALKDAFPDGTGGLGRMLSPISEAPAEADNPIDKWIWDNKDTFAHGEQGSLGLQRPGRNISISGGPNISAQVQLSPEAHSRYQELAGNATKDPRTGMGAKDTLNALAEGRHPTPGLQQEWDTAAPAAKALMVQRIVQQYRTAGKQQLLQEYPDIGQAAQAQWQKRAAALKGAPTMEGAGQ